MGKRPSPRALRLDDGIAEAELVEQRRDGANARAVQRRVDELDLVARLENRLRLQHEVGDGVAVDDVHLGSSDDDLARAS